VRTYPFLLATASVFVSLVAHSRGTVIPVLPNPDDQGGMIMPLVTIQALSGGVENPTSGIINVSFSPTTVPVLRSIIDWGNIIGPPFQNGWFAETAAWRADLSPRIGSIAGMPPENAGAGGLFNNQYGFMYMGNGSMMMAFVPAGKSLGIRLTSVSSPLLEAFNYAAGSANRWDKVWAGGVGSQVLWNGSMWHNYFTMPDTAPAGTYTAGFEVFIADLAFTGTTGFAQYDPPALTAAANPNFTPASFTYTFTVIPEPGVVSLLCVAALVFGLARVRSKHARGQS
jgi:hypothetical protein